MKRTANLNEGDEAMTLAIGALARVVAEFMDDGDEFMVRIRRVWADLARQTQEGEVARNVYIALSQTPLPPSASPQ